MPGREMRKYRRPILRIHRERDGGKLMTEVRKIMDQLKATQGIIGCGIVSKDGRPVEMRLPLNMNVDTIAIMAATVFGGSMTLNTEAGKQKPKTINIKTEGFRTNIYQCGKRSLAIVMMDEDSDNEKVSDYIDQLENEFGTS